MNEIVSRFLLAGEKFEIAINPKSEQVWCVSFLTRK